MRAKSELPVNQKGAGDESPDALREARRGRDVPASHLNDSGAVEGIQTDASTRYRALREVKYAQRLRIVRLIEKAGERGWDLMLTFEQAQYADDAAWRALTHDERMAILEEERVEREALLARLSKREARRHGASA